MVDIASGIIATRPTGSVRRKGDHDFYSEVDTEVEEVIREFLGRRTPNLGFLGEENPEENTRADTTWVLDPLDGTSNFIHDIPLCGVSLGVVREDTPIVGVIDLPFLRERYWAAVGRGAFANSRILNVTERHSLKEAIVSIGDYAVGQGAEEKSRARLALTRLLAPQVERIRMFGSASIDLAWLSAGRTNASIALGDKPWDMVAGVVIARESGAVVFDVDGSDYTTGSRATIATCKTLAIPVQSIVSRAVDIAVDHPEKWA